MRRKRTPMERYLYVVAALVALMLVALAALAVDRAQMRDEIRRLQSIPDEPVVMPTETGGAEIPVVAPVPVAGWRFPIAAEDYRMFTSPFGIRVSPLLNVEMAHTGLDIAAVWRAQVVAIADGIVVVHYPPPGTPYPGGGVYRGHPVFGGYIEIEHEDGTRSAYAHMSWTRVNEGERVVAGEVIGRIGNTGKSDGEHLHFSIQLPDGTMSNPLLWVPTP